MTHKPKGETSGHTECHGRCWAQDPDPQTQHSCELSPDGEVQALECGKDLDPEVEVRPEKRSNPYNLPSVSAIPSGPRISATHPPLGDRKSVSSSSPAPNIAGFSPRRRRGRLYPVPVTAHVVKRRGGVLLSGRANSLTLAQWRGDGL